MAKSRLIKLMNSVNGLRIWIAILTRHPLMCFVMERNFYDAVPKWNQITKNFFGLHPL